MSYEIHKLNAQLAILKDVAETYPTSKYWQLHNTNRITYQNI